MSDLSGSGADPSRPSADVSSLRPAETFPPRPQYGEYATPEEQNLRAGRPLAPIPPVVAAPTASLTKASEQRGDSATSAPTSGAHPVDRFVAILLLGYGLWNVISSTFTYLNPASLMTAMMQMTGVSGTFSNYSQARAWGIAAGIVLIVGWILTAAWTVQRVRRGKLTWWVPLVGGVVFVTVTSIFMLVPFFADPAVVSFLNTKMP